MTGTSEEETAPSPATKEDTPTWESIKSLEKDRLDLLGYEGTTSYHLIFRFQHTVFHYLLLDPLFWITVGVYVVMRILDKAFDEIDGEDIFSPKGEIAVIGAFLSFILTFFVNQALTNNAQAYDRSMSAKGKITEFAQVGFTVLPTDRITRIVRLLNAAHLVGYAGLADHYTKDNFILPLNREMKLLTDAELARLNGLKHVTGTRYCFQIVMWVMNDIKDSLDAQEIDVHTAIALQGLAQEFRRAMSQHFNAANIPIVSFYYFHLISLLCAIYLPLFAAYEAFQASAISTGFTGSDIVEFIVVAAQSCYVIGMRSLAVKLMTPYGKDVEDLTLVTFIRAAWNSSNQTLRTFEDEQELINDPVTWNEKESASLLAFPMESRIG